MTIENKEVKAWNLWWNTMLTDDPDAWDGEIRSINEMQRRLGGLSTDQRLIRAQIAEFCRENPFFPGSIDILCKEIGHGRFQDHFQMGCEGRGLLDSLGYKDQGARARVLGEYRQSLTTWLDQRAIKTSTDSRLFRFLGKPNQSNKAFVVKLLSELSSERTSMAHLKNLSEGLCSENPLFSLSEAGARPFCCFRCEASGKEDAIVPKCLCSDAMVIDSGLLCTRTSDGDWSRQDEFRHFREEYVLAYVTAINSWLKGEAAEPVTSITATSYVTEEQASIIPESVNSALGERRDAKMWLAACLLKTAKDNQRWHPRKELIDDFPEASSWFAETP